MNKASLSLISHTNQREISEVNARAAKNLEFFEQCSKYYQFLQLLIKKLNKKDKTMRKSVTDTCLDTNKSTDSELEVIASLTIKFKLHIQKFFLFLF